MKTKTYTVTVSEDEAGKSRMHRVNDGFSVLELLGLAAMLQQELMAQFQGELTPVTVLREVVVDNHSGLGM